MNNTNGLGFCIPLDKTCKESLIRTKNKKHTITEGDTYLIHKNKHSNWRDSYLKLVDTK